jgi:autotransporter-associated beta strand protein
MRSKLFFFLVLVVCIHSMFVCPVFAQRPMEMLDRSVIAQKVSNGVYVNWRITSDEWYNTSYKLYRDGILLFTTTSMGASNYIDQSGTLSSKYSVSKVKNGVESVQSKEVSVLSKSYLEIPMRDINALGKTGYSLGDATAADLDGDGQFEIIVKRVRQDWSQTSTTFTYFEAYKLDGTFMWAIDVGPNITFDVEVNIAAFDFDGDGKAEVFMRSSDNTVFGLDKNNQNGTSIGDRDGDGVTNYRYSISTSPEDGFMNAGPEYLSLIDGVTGKELDWTNFIPRGNSSDWGDGYGHRANKFFFGAPYLDGKKPSLFIGRGIYTMTKMKTYDVVNKKLVARWNWETTSSTQRFQGKYDTSPKNYFGQGYHNYTIADVDGDGCDEITWGSMAIDHDGKPQYSTELGHGDAHHIGDFDPYRKGVEFFGANESNPGCNLRDAKTGQILYRKVSSSDVGRAAAGNITDLYKGAEAWANGSLSATEKNELGSFGMAANFLVYWDGDLLQEVLDHNGFSTSTGIGYGQISKFNGFGNVSSLLIAEAASCNWTKGTPCLQADIMGDWREEAIWRRTDNMALRIYTTPYSTTNRIYTLMHDHQYRQAICWQMCGYNQPPHTSFYLGSEFPTPIPAKSTNGKLVWKGTTSTWNTSEANFEDGNDAVGLIANNSVSLPFENGKSVLLDAHGISKSVELTSEIQPELLVVSGSDNYTIGGLGTLSGSMRMDKLGEGTLTLNGNHSYTGATEVWEGDMWMNGQLTQSPIMIRRHANFGGNGKIGNGISTEYNAGVYIGGKSISDTLTVNGMLRLAEGAKLYFDLSDSLHSNLPMKRNDFLRLNGTLQLTKGAMLYINQTSGVLAQGSYILATVDAIMGDLSSLKIVGALGVATELSYNASSKELSLIVKGVRNAGTVAWSGANDANWDLSKTANWNMDGFSDIFVSKDSVLFNSGPINTTINLVDDLPVSYMEVNSTGNYSFSGTGALTGSMSLYKTNTGLLSINNRNSFTGKTIVDGGALIMKYAPSPTSNGGIGINTTDPSYLQLKDSAILQVTTANESTNRGVTLSGVAGGLMNVDAGLYWNGIVQGTKLTKYGAGTLYIGSNNTNLNETVLKAGKIILRTNESVLYGVGKKITLLGGTLEALNNSSAYLTSSHDFDIPEGISSTIIAAARCSYNGSLRGAGNLTWNCDFVRAYINGNWSAFSGNLNITANSANGTYGNEFIVNNAYGLPNATVSLGNNVTMCYKGSTNNDGTSTIKLGMLTGVAGAVFFNAGLEVGATNKSGSYSGIIKGLTSVKKVGTGNWYLAGLNINTGNTLVSAGTLTINSGASIGTGSVYVSSGAIMSNNGTIGGPVTVATGGTLSNLGILNASLSNSGTFVGTGSILGTATLADNSITKPGNDAIGTLNVGSDVTMTPTSVLTMQVINYYSGSDKLIIAGTLKCNGTLNVSVLSGAIQKGITYQLFDAASITGTFTTLNLPALPDGWSWNTSELYTTGKIMVESNTALNNSRLGVGIIKNPTTGLFIGYIDHSLANLSYRVTDLQGKVIFQSKIEECIDGKFEVNLTDHSKGVYLLTLYTGKNKLDEFKLIKE